MWYRLFWEETWLLLLKGNVQVPNEYLETPEKSCKSDFDYYSRRQREIRISFRKHQNAKWHNVCEEKKNIIFLKV